MHSQEQRLAKTAKRTMRPMPKHRPRTHYLLYDGRACAQDSNNASVLVSCDDDAEARTYAVVSGDMACYSYNEKTQVERWEWNWLVDGGFSTEIKTRPPERVTS